MTFSDQRFIEDPKFLQWIFHNNRLVNQYWEQYLYWSILKKKLRLLSLKPAFWN